MDLADIDELERILKGLGNRNRLHLLVSLQKPRRVPDLTLPPSKAQGWGSDDRPISRQAVLGHVQALEELGVAKRLQEGPQDVRYVVNHARLFELTERLRELSTVRADVPVRDHTLAFEVSGGRARYEGPHLVLVRGVREGAVFPLADSREPGAWVIGRDSGLEVSLDYDPYVSATHAQVISKKGQHFLLDLQENRNGTFLNWERMVRGGVAPLAPGDLIGVGMSLLLYRR